MEEPQYEIDDYCATSGFGTIIDATAQEATRYIIKHTVGTDGLLWAEAYMLCLNDA